MTTLTHSLSPSNMWIQGPSRTVFLYHWIITHHGREATLATVALSQHIGADVAHKPTPQQAVGSMHRFRAPRSTPFFTCSSAKTCVDAKQGQIWRANRRTCDRYSDNGKNMLYVHHSVTGGLFWHSALEQKLPRSLEELAQHINQPDLVELARRFLHDQLYPDGPPVNEVALEECPEIDSKLSVFGSATETFYTLSDECEHWGMRRECIRSTHSWRNQGPHHDCVLVVEDETKPGIKGLTPAAVHARGHVCPSLCHLPFSLEIQAYECHSGIPLIHINDVPQVIMVSSN